MGFGPLRSIIGPAFRLLFTKSHFSPATRTFSSSTTTTAAPSLFRHLITPNRLPWIQPCSSIHSLTETRLPKRRPEDKPRRKRASLKPRGPYAWVKCEPDEPLPANQPNQGSVKRRNEKKIKLQRAWIMSEKRKRRAEMQEAKRKKIMKRVERKMAAVARERAWAERLVELQRIEAEKKATSV